MKKLISTAIAAIFITAVPVSSAYTQPNNEQNFASDLYPAIVRPLDAEKLYADNTKAIRNFRKEFKNTTGESWYALQDGYRVKFLQNGVYNMADYNAKGKWLRTIRYYDEQGLPKDIRNAVRHEFLDFNIFLVMEMNLPQSIIYLVKIEDKTSWKTVRVSGDDIDVVESFTK
ncbi:hypothetical protein [Flavihumibacter solisilvae]|uniref:Uncharacterized protein n=1 Tax=Flavihumibacter solisilvae TaxID=1349421 RepID=A0A0C1LAX5_9BACT|nr:hypothetical protein [Flavihumibacter solisilvae]KIC92678.1 hypothetical protein OI18_21385 [Flavihumibacter solisilvae]